MMPCKFCGESTDKGDRRVGMRQVGKTKRIGPEYQRVYRCRECRATMVMTGDDRTGIFADQWTPPPAGPKELPPKA